jgi:serine/threonine protein kinase HipA of HipAB toxin-antitoxin module
MIRDYEDLDDLLELLRRVTFNVAVANADAHAKNLPLSTTAKTSALPYPCL